VSDRADGPSLAARLWKSRWPEAAWAVFAVGNLTWMVLMPSWSMLPYHFTWISLLLLYGLGYRTATRALTWWLLVPVMAGAALLFADARIRALAPYDELIELPVMVVLLFAITKSTSHRRAAMAALDQVSRRNAELLERQRMFVQNASHELRTPITVALAHAELLPERYSAEAAAADAAADAAIVVDELGRLRRLVDRLLLLATAEQHDLARSAPIRLTPLADDALRRWAAVPRQWLRGSCDDVTVLADPGRLEVALDAVLDNAVRFTGDGGSIELSARRDGREAAVTVADSGPGIPEDRLELVFDRFDGADPRRDSAHNFGLGLSIVRAIAEAHGGRVTAGRGPAGGAAVTIWLPLHRPAAALPGDADDPAGRERAMSGQDPSPPMATGPDGPAGRLTQDRG
jgi:two-component system, OmpR family, sensor kinase